MTEFLIISSTKDKASQNIRQKLLSSNLYKFDIVSGKWSNNALYQLTKLNSHNKVRKGFLKENKVYLGLTNERLIFLNNLDIENSIINPDILIFASRHASKTGRPSFLVHTTGNWSGDIKYGGEKQELSKASALLLKAGYLTFKEMVAKGGIEDFSIDLEVSHHGPTNLEKPLLFMELGSSASQWHHNRAGIIVADSIIETLIKYTDLKREGKQKIGVGFGGTHYAPQFQKLIENNNVAVSFIVPKYFIKGLTVELIEQMIQNNLESVDYFIIDWSGVNSADKKHLLPLLENFDIPIRKIKDF